MQTVIKYNPWSILRDIQGEVNQLFNQEHNTSDLSNVETSEWSPRVDIKEEPNKFIITADLPGVDPKEIEISMKRNVLSIKGTRRIDRNIKKEHYSRIERFSGLFYRQFALPAEHVNSEEIQAKSKHGVLEIIIPKKEGFISKKIEVQEESD